MTTLTHSSRRRTSAPSEVWDLSPATRNACRAASVRQLRAAAVPAMAASSDDGVRRNVFEPDRERRDRVLLGFMMAGALLIGSLFGGAFGQDGLEVAPSGNAASGTVKAVSVAQPR